jgi:hypothetical protein
LQLRPRERNCFVKREDLLSLCAADLSGLGSDPIVLGMPRAVMKPRPWPSRHPFLGHTADLRSYIDLRYARQWLNPRASTSCPRVRKARQIKLLRAASISQDCRHG